MGLDSIPDSNIHSIKDNEDDDMYHYIMRDLFDMCIYSIELNEECDDCVVLRIMES